MSRFYAKKEAINYNKETQRIIFAASSVHAVITLCVIINERLFCSYLEGSANLEILNIESILKELMDGHLNT